MHIDDIERSLGLPELVNDVAAELAEPCFFRKLLLREVIGARCVFLALLVIFFFFFFSEEDELLELLEASCWASLLTRLRYCSSDSASIAWPDDEVAEASIALSTFRFDRRALWVLLNVKPSTPLVQFSNI